jgi:hypothetical protein
MGIVPLSHEHESREWKKRHTRIEIRGNNGASSDTRAYLNLPHTGMSSCTIFDYAGGRDYLHPISEIEKIPLRPPIHGDPGTHIFSLNSREEARNVRESLEVVRPFHKTIVLRMVIK